MKLDVNVLRYLSRDDFRTLTAVEMGQKNHEIVPAQLVDTIAGLKHGGTFKCLRNLLRHKLVHHDGQKYDGYRLTTLGYDFLAIRALTARGSIAGVGRQIGVGKESDVFEVMDDDGNVMALKLHRLGRTSFRAVKSKRDYMRRGSHYSWLYLSRLAALKEFAFMKALGEAGLPVPKAIECNRHAVLMTMIDAHPMVQVHQLGNPRKVYEECMRILVKLAQLGLVHCDYNEFNLLISENEELTLIDFPQMVSISHANAQELFERDVEGVVRFFEKKLGYLPEGDPALELIRPRFEDSLPRAPIGSPGGEDGGKSKGIDEVLRASGFKKEHQKDLERFITVIGKKRGDNSSDSSSYSNSSDSEEEESGSEEGASDSRSWVSREEEEGSEEGSDEEEIRRTDIGVSEDEGDQEIKAQLPGAGPAAAVVVENNEESGGLLEGEVQRKMRLDDDAAGEVVARAADERRRAARRAAMAKVSRNATKSKNKGKKKGDTGPSVGGGGVWG